MDPSETVIYYNPKCSKCRMTLKLLKEQGEEPEVVEYLQTVPTRGELERVLSLLGMTARQILRKNEPACKQAGLDENSSDEEILEAMMATRSSSNAPSGTTTEKPGTGSTSGNVLEIL